MNSKPQKTIPPEVGEFDLATFNRYKAEIPPTSGNLVIVIVSITKAENVKQLFSEFEIIADYCENFLIISNLNNHGL